MFKLIDILREVESDNNISTILARYNKSRETDYHITQKLGSGLNGEAWRINENKVFKLTRAPDEAWTSSMLIGKNTNYFSNVYDVVAYERDYIIVQEFLNTGLISKITSDIDKILDKFNMWEFSKITMDRILQISNNKYAKQLWDIIEEGQNLGFQALDINIGNLGFKGSHLALFDIMDHKQRKVKLDEI